MSSHSDQRRGSVAVIGAGYWGKNLVRNFYQLNSLKLICEKSEILLANMKQQYPEIPTTMTLSEALSSHEIQGVVISTPAETHYTLAREAILWGKHVFVEKPLALTEAEAYELSEMAEERGLTLMVGHLLQYHPVFIRLKELALSGELGRINYIYSHRLNLGKIRREENILWSFAPHDISMILAIAGEEPESVLATGGNYLHRKIADVTTTHLEFPSGLRAQIFVSWLHPFKEQKLVVVGDRKMAVFDDTQPWGDKLLLYPHEIKWQNNLPVPAKADAERLEILEEEPLRKECEHFLQCMSNGHRPITDGKEGLRVLRVLNASQRSLNEEGCKVFLNGDIRQRYLVESTPTHVAGSVPSLDRVRPVKAEPGAHGEVFIHESAVVDQPVAIGKGTKIWHFSHILPGCRIGEGCNIGQNVVIGPDVVIGSRCKLQNNVSVYKGVTLEDGVFCGPSMVFTNVYNPRAEIKKMDQVRPTLVKRGATIGANATIVCGTTIGRYAFIGAGTVVTRNVPDHALVVGNPARRIGWACECGERLPEDLECLACGKSYEECDQGLKERCGHT